MRINLLAMLALTALLASGLAPTPASGQAARESLASVQPSQLVSLLHVIQPLAVDGKDEPPVITSLELAPDGHTMALGGDDHRVRLWDLARNRLLAALDTHTDWVRVARFSPDGQSLVTAGNDRRAIVWPAQRIVTAATHAFTSGAKGEIDWSEEAVELTRHSGAIIDVAFSPDGRFLAICGFENELQIYDFKRRQVVRTLSGPCCDLRRIAFSPDGRYLAAAGRCGMLRMWEVEQDLVADGAKNPPPARDFRVSNRRVRALLFSADNRYVFTAGEDRQVCGFEAATGKKWFEIPAQPAKVFTLAQLDGTTLAAAGSDNRIRIIDIAAGKEIDRLTGHTGSVAALSLAGGTLVSGGYDTTVRVWDIARILQPDTRAQREATTIR